MAPSPLFLRHCAAAAGSSWEEPRHTVHCAPAIEHTSSSSSNSSSSLHLLHLNMWLAGSHCQWQHCVGPALGEARARLRTKRKTKQFRRDSHSSTMLIISRMYRIYFLTGLPSCFLSLSFPPAPPSVRKRDI